MTIVSKLCLFCLFTFSCHTTPQSNCGSNAGAGRFGRSHNNLRLKYDVPIVHDYLCFVASSKIEESWRAPIDFQLASPKGFHAGKTIFPDTGAELDEKDIFRHRIDDSTFNMLGFVTEVRDGAVTVRSIWYDTIDVKIVTHQELGRRFSDTRKGLSLQQADSILASWGTSRR
jgi:hypothetical protein